MITWALCLVKNPIHRKRSKDILVQYHYICQVGLKHVLVHYHYIHQVAGKGDASSVKVRTKENVADMLIKKVQVEKLEWSMVSLGLKDK